jgi:hypothetical protein
MSIIALSRRGIARAAFASCIRATREGRDDPEDARAIGTESDNEGE